MVSSIILADILENSNWNSDPIYICLCLQFPDDSDYFDGSGSGAGFQEDFEFLEVQTFDDKNTYVQNESNSNDTFNSQFNSEVALNSNNSTKIIPLPTNYSETDINYTQKSRNNTIQKTVSNVKGIESLNRKSAMDINNTQESRNDTITKTRFNVEEIKNINIQSMTDIIYAQKSRNDTISKTIISDEKIKNHNRI